MGFSLNFPRSGRENAYDICIFRLSNFIYSASREKVMHSPVGQDCGGTVLGGWPLSSFYSLAEKLSMLSDQLMTPVTQGRKVAFGSTL